MVHDFVTIVNSILAETTVGMTVHKEVIVTATSSSSWEQAALNAVDRTEATVENIQWSVVQDQSIKHDPSGDPEFKTKVKIGFEVEG